MHRPLAVPPGVRVRYVDYLTREEKLRKFPELDPRTLVTPDIIDDCFVLARVPAASQQFVAANHVLEHASNPLGTLRNWWRVLKPGGVLFMAVPIRDRSFDHGRALTALAHVIDDDALVRRDATSAFEARNLEH